MLEMDLTNSRWVTSWGVRRIVAAENLKKFINSWETSLVNMASPMTGELAEVIIPPRLFRFQVRRGNESESRPRRSAMRAQVGQRLRLEAHVTDPAPPDVAMKRGRAASTGLKTCAGSIPAATAKAKASWIGRLGVPSFAECVDSLPTDREESQKAKETLTL